MTIDDSPLLAAIKDPTCTKTLTPEQWNRLLRQSDMTGVSARLYVQLEELGLLEAIPDRARLRLNDSFVFARFVQSRMRFEVNRIGRALLEQAVPMILLKGSAYLIAGLPPSRGRLASDIDVMVPKEQLDRVRNGLIAAGWQGTAVRDYDEHYYTTWMHEIAPLWHPEREMATDVHHTIAPPSSRVHPEVEALWAAAVDAGDGLKILCPADMVLHAAVHLFNEEFRAGFRDLVDLHDLLSHFGREDTFWTSLQARAEKHGMARVHHYLLRYTTMLLGTPVPPASLERTAEAAPNTLVATVMDNLVREALTPSDGQQESRFRSFALWCLYVRSHWLRMPPLLLARHLSIKAWFRVRDSLVARASR